MRRVWAMAALVVLAVAALSGCSTTFLRLTVTPHVAFLDRELAARVTGSAPHAVVTLQLTTKSADGSTWSSRAVFRADTRGDVTTGQAPLSGDYAGARPMGLSEALHPSAAHADVAFKVPEPWRLSFTATADGAAPAHVTVTRQLCPSVVSTRTLTVASDGVDGQLDEPLHPAAAAQPAVVVIPGSDGVMPSGDACLLAANGYPSLAVAYFNATGLPKQLADIPLEYFEHAARLLAKQPHVDPKRIVLWGNSRGSEAALLAAADFPDLIHAVIGTVPSSDVHPATPPATGAAWTLAGRPLPYTTSRDAPTLDGPAAIPIERIAGPILLVCGGRDQIWASCPYADGIRTRLDLRHATARLTLLAYPQAGHFVGSLIPNVPLPVDGATIPGGADEISGGTMLMNDEARDDAYARLLPWLAALRR